MFKYLDRGKTHADNLIDNLLSFNVGSTWTTVGTGTALIDNNEYFEGSGSLRLTNNAYKTTELTANNSVQSTVIPFDGTYDFSLYLKKTLAEDMSIDVEIYNNASLVYDTTFTFSDVDNWTSFITNENFSFLKGDEITFRFKINNNASSAVTSASLWIDGLHLYNKERNQLEAPIFSKANGLLYNDYTGWGVYNDTTYTTGSPFTVTAGAAAVALPNDAGSKIETQKPLDITTFYDGTVITGRNGDGLNITFEFKARPTGAAADPRITIAIDIGGAIGELYPRDFVLSKGSGVEHNIVSSYNVYTLDTWEANGGTVMVSVANEDVEIYDIRYVLTRSHKAR